MRGPLRGRPGLRPAARPRGGTRRPHAAFFLFTCKIDPADHPAWPDGITQVDFGELKQKLLGSIVAIAAVDSLGWYLELGKTT